jgi:Flp pilus assembly protein TadD
VFVKSFNRSHAGVLFVLCMSVLAGCAIHHPRTNDDLIRFGIKLARMGYWHEAAVHWRMVIEEDPENAAALNNLAVAAEVEGFSERARQGYEKALKLRPDSEYIKKNLGAIERRASDETTRAPEKKDSNEKHENKEWLPE